MYIQYVDEYVIFRQKNIQEKRYDGLVSFLNMIFSLKTNHLSNKRTTKRSDENSDNFFIYFFLLTTL